MDQSDDRRDRKSLGLQRRNLKRISGLFDGSCDAADEHGSPEDLNRLELADDNQFLLGMRILASRRQRVRSNSTN